jgi:head-tail adaptor
MQDVCQPHATINAIENQEVMKATAELERTDALL